MRISRSKTLTDYLLVMCFALGFSGLYGCEHSTAPASASASTAHTEEETSEARGDTKQEKQEAKEVKKEEKQEGKEVKDEKKEEKDVPKPEIRNNAASLLADLLGQEKDVSKLLVIKHPSPSVKRLVEAISKQADQGSKQIEELAKNDSTLKLDAIHLPPGEQAARDAESKAEEKALLLSFGRKFETNLMVSQAQALSYASNLAKVAGDNSSSDAEQREFHALQTSFNDLYERVVTRVSGQEPSKSS
jgi:hypothetical protein